jgi:hypothetical protein
VEEFKYLGATLTNQNSIHEEQTQVGECLLSFGGESFVFQVAIQKYKDLGIQNRSFTCCLYGRETWSLTLRQEQRLRVFENRVLRRIFGPKRDKAMGVEKTT